MRDQYLQLDAARLRYRDEGTGTALLLVHGWTLDLEMWDPLVARLAGECRIVRFDRRGFGLSTGSPAIASDITDIAALAAHLGLGRMVLLGMSQGARAALGFAAAAPDRLDGLILDGPPDFTGAPGAEADVPVRHYRERMRVAGIAAFRLEWSSHPLAQLQTQDPGAQRLVAAMLERYSGHDLRLDPLGQVPPAADFTQGTVAVPTLIITGACDIVSRVAAARGLAQRLPHAAHVYIPEGGHLAAIDNPDAYSQLVHGFIRRHTSATV